MDRLILMALCVFTLIARLIIFDDGPVKTGIIWIALMLGIILMLLNTLRVILGR